jgi:hypothetical protein
MAYRVEELAVVLANLALVMASWRVLYLNRGGFEGEGAMVDRGITTRARGSR